MSRHGLLRVDESVAVEAVVAIAAPTRRIVRTGDLIGGRLEGRRDGARGQVRRLTPDEGGNASGVR